jgi:hypothetical protein
MAVEEGNGTAVAEKKSPNAFFSLCAAKTASFFKNLGKSFINFFQGIGRFFRGYARIFTRGDWATKLSFLIMGFGFFFHGERQMVCAKDGTSKERYVIAWLPGLVFFLFQVAFNLVFFLWGLPYISHLSLQGLAKSRLHLQQNHDAERVRRRQFVPHLTF